MHIHLMKGYFVKEDTIIINRDLNDLDLFVKDVLEKLFLDLEKNNFWCYQGETIDAVYPYVKEMQSIRFARIGELFPNMEVIFIDLTKKAKSYEFNHPQKIKIRDFEDARHLRVFFSEILNKEKFEECKKVIMEDKKW